MVGKAEHEAFSPTAFAYKSTNFSPYNLQVTKVHAKMQGVYLAHETSRNMFLPKLNSCQTSASSDQPIIKY